MVILFTFVGAVYAASCVWLTVRIANLSEKSPKRIAAIAVAPLLYAFSFGPMFSLG
jgi:hypothetical protein